MSGLVTVLQGHVLDQLKTLPADSVQTCITSPPYWGLRAYGTEPQTWPDGWVGELGLEPTPQLYVEHLVEVFREVRRVLRPDGTLWLNLGDSHAASPRGNKPGDFSTSSLTNPRRQDDVPRPTKEFGGLKQKDLVGIPWMAAFALRDDGWYLRMDNVWAKGVSGQKELTSTLRTALQKAHLTPDQVHRVLAHMEPYIGNCMPESVKDRPTKSHEYVFLLSKGPRAYCDMSEVSETSGWDRTNDPKWQGARVARNAKKGAGNRNAADGGFTAWQPASGRNRRSVWLVPPVPYKGAHFATMPPKLVEPCLLAATSPKGQCAVCGAPWKAQRVKGEPLVAQQQASGADAAGEYHGEGTKDYAAGLAQNPSDVKRRILDGMRERTVTWQPSCTCDHPDLTPSDPEPQIVLDPFGGSGTTAMVAQAFGRRAITVELNASYVPLIEARVAKGR